MAGRIRPAREDELPDVQAISLAAGLRYADHPDPRVATCADDDPILLSQLQGWLDRGRLWVAADAVDEPVGFLGLDVVDDLGHVEEVSVHPDHQGQGHGAALLDEAAVWCVATGRSGLTLTTFRDVEWNAPYYERRGFRALEDDEIGTELRARATAEAERGLDPELRVCMFRDLA